MNRDGDDQLHICNAELEGQLTTATRTARAQERINTAQRDALAYAVSILDTVREPLVVLDGEMGLKTASRAFYQTFGVLREETIGQFLYDLGIGQWNIPALRTLLEEVLPKEKSVVDFEVVHEFPALGRRVMLLNARELWSESKDTERVLLAIEDITERKRTEEELLRSNEDLQRFAYVVAHDLRSPLNRALNLLKLLGRCLEGRLDKEEAGMLTLSVEGLERLTKLTRDLLTQSEGDGDANQPRTLSPMQEPLTIARANLQQDIEECKATITVGELPSAPVERAGTALLFQNLIANALKYRREETPRIVIKAVQEGGYLQVSVRDNGQGFKAEYATLIFDPFKRLHGASVPGSGIGLATYKRIVERAGGRIWAVSTPGAGSTFHFSLPVEQGKTGVRPAKAGVFSGRTSPR